MYELIKMPMISAVGMWTRLGSRNYGNYMIPTGRGTFEGVTSGFFHMSLVLTFGFPYMLSNSIPIGQPQNQLSVKQNLPNEISAFDVACCQNSLTTDLTAAKFTIVMLCP